MRSRVSGVKVAATTLTAYGVGLVPPANGMSMALIRDYSITWVMSTDDAKPSHGRQLDPSSTRHRAFLRRLYDPIAN